jgi:hypothetical protein
METAEESSGVGNNQAIVHSLNSTTINSILISTWSSEFPNVLFSMSHTSLIVFLICCTCKTFCLFVVYLTTLFQ